MEKKNNEFYIYIGAKKTYEHEELNDPRSIFKPSKITARTPPPTKR